MNTNGSSGLSKHELFHFSQCLWLEFGFIIIFIEFKFLCNSKLFLVFEFVSLGSLDPPYAHAGCKNNTHQFFLIHRDARASLFAIAPNKRAHVHMHTLISHAGNPAWRFVSPKQKRVRTSTRYVHVVDSARLRAPIAS